MRNRARAIATRCCSPRDSLATSVRAPRHFHQLKKLTRPLDLLRGRPQSREVARRQHVPERRQAGHEMEVLKNKADMVAPPCVTAGLAEPAEFDLTPANLAAVRRKNAGQDVSQRRLAGAGGPDERHLRARIEGKPVEIERRRGVCAEGDAQAARVQVLAGRAGTSSRLPLCHDIVTCLRSGRRESGSKTGRVSMRQVSIRRAGVLAATTALVALATWSAQAENARLVQGEDPYFKQAQGQLQRILTQQTNTNRAKNVILIVGDGMGFSTVTAARIFEGQQRGVDGESNVLAWEAFPYLAASKTYSADAQITDSAPSAVAMTTGVKTINDLMGLDHTAKLESCEDQKTKAVTTLVGAGRDHRHVDRCGHHGDGSPTRRPAPPTPTSPIATGNPMPPCRPRRSSRAAPTSPASWWR